MTRRPLQAIDRGDGQVVVLLHGQPGQGQDWNEVTDLLAQRLRVVVPDRPGYGRTGGAARGIADNADAVIDLLDRLDLSAATVVGHSWGGAVALDLARRHPQRVNGIVLVASVGGRGSINRLDRVLSLPIVGPVFSLVGLSFVRASPVRKVMAWLGAPATPGTSESASSWYAAWRSFVVEQRALIVELPAIVKSLSSIATPAVVVIGQTDKVVPCASQEHLATNLLCAQVVRVDGVGHLIPQKTPEAVADVIVAAVLAPGGAVPGAQPPLAADAATEGPPWRAADAVRQGPPSRAADAAMQGPPSLAADAVPEARPPLTADDVPD